MVYFLITWHTWQMQSPSMQSPCPEQFAGQTSEADDCIMVRKRETPFNILRPTHENQI